VRRRFAPLLALAALIALTDAASAAGAIRFVGSVQAKAPPRTLGGVTMLKVGRDRRKTNRTVSLLTTPIGDLTFSRAVWHYTITHRPHQSWQTWSNGYGGDVYFVARPPLVTLRLPPKTVAFYFFVEPNDQSRKGYKVTATCGSVSSGPLTVHGNGGARFFGFVASHGAHLSTITVSSNDRASYDPRTKRRDPGGFAIGEFGIARG